MAALIGTHSTRAFRPSTAKSGSFRSGFEISFQRYDRARVGCICSAHLHHEVMTQTKMLEEQADRAAASGNYAAAKAILQQVTGAGAGRLDLWIKLSAMSKASGDLQGSLAAINRA